MSFHLSANQYESSFGARRLQNFEVPSQLNKQWPTARKGSTRIISNDNGHILIKSKRSPSSPWGTFVGTWQKERKPIQLMTKTRLYNPHSNIQYCNTTKPKQKTTGYGIAGDPTNENLLEPKPEVVSSSPEAEAGNINHESCSIKNPTSRPESRMRGSGTQSPLGSRPPTDISGTSST